MSSKQLARTVTEGRQITFHVSRWGHPIEGYLCGMDDFHWMVIASDGTKYLIHKASASVIEFAEESSYGTEVAKSQLESVIGPFRRFVEAEFFGRTDASASVEGIAV